MSDVQRSSNIDLAEIGLRFASNNGVPVERASLRANEWAALKSEIERLQMSLKRYEPINSYDGVDIEQWRQRALAAERDSAETTKSREEKLEFALRGLYWDTVDYLTLNKLGGMDNHWMRAARVALGIDPNDTRPAEKTEAGPNNTASAPNNSSEQCEHGNTDGTCKACKLHHDAERAAYMADRDMGLS